MARSSKASLGVGDDFEGRRITKTTIALTNAGDGLSQAMKIDPQALHQGDTVYVLIEAEVGKITFDPYDDGVCSRVQNLRAGVATLVDSNEARETIEWQREALRHAADEERGQGDMLKLREDHDAGKHDTPAAGCVLCDAVAAVTAPDDDEWETPPPAAAGE